MPDRLEHTPDPASRWRLPPPLRAGDRVFITAPSSGVPTPLHARLDLALAQLRDLGFVVEEGRCLRDEQQSMSAPAADRAAELQAALLRDDLAAVMPPWGGERAMELLPLLDWPAIAAARPKWLLGYSDLSTLMLPLLLRAGWASAHGPNLLDRVAGQNDPLTAGMLPLLMRPALTGAEQAASEANTPVWDDWAQQPGALWRFTTPTRWQVLGEDRPVSVQGRLVGGCLDTLSRLAGTPFGDVPGYLQRHRDDGVLLYLENCELKPLECLRALLGLKFAGWFDGVAALLLGRSAGPDVTEAGALSYQGALQAALGDLPCPVLFDMDIGHRAPQLTLVNGALARLERVGHGGRLVYL